MIDELRRTRHPRGEVSRRLFDHLGPDHVELELARIVDAPGVTHLRYRVRR